MLKFTLIALVSVATAAPAFAQQGGKPAKPSGKLTYASCMEQKQKAGLPAARAAQVCQAILKSQ
jgi:hypothetical protein